MKRLILTFIAVTAILNYTSAQSRLGFTENDIKYKEFSEKKFTCSYATTDNTRYCYWNDENQIVVYDFDLKGLCNQTVIVPLNSGRLNGLVELYNKNYVIINNTEWKIYSEKGIIQVKLIFPENATPYFRYLETK